MPEPDQGNRIMMDERKTLVFRMSTALTKGLSIVRGMKQLNEEQRKRVAETILNELESTNWKITLGEAANGLAE
jgi:hypothetical protein